MHRVLYVFLPNWAIDRLRRNGLLPSSGAQPAEEAPFATIVTAGGKQLLAAVNPAAAAKGIARGLPLADALSFLPGLVTRPAEPAADEAALRRLAEWCGRYSPWTAPDFSQTHGHDGVKIEVTGSAHLWGGEAELAADLSKRLARQGIVHRLAIADTIGAAWGFARYAAHGVAPLIAAPETTREALAPLPVAALRLDPTIVHGLHRVGLRRVDDVIKMPRDALAHRFGEDVTRRLDQALGDLPEPLSPLGEVPSRRVRLSFAEPISDPTDLARAVERLTQDLVTRLAREGMGARRLTLGFHRVDGRVEHIRIGTARPSRDPVHLARLMIGKLDTVDPGLGIEDAILAAFAAEALAPEQLETPLPVKRREEPAPSPAGGGGSGWGAERKWEPSLAPLFDRIAAKLGPDALARLEARESHIPERASVAVPITENDAFRESPRSPMGGEGRVRGAGKPGANPHPVVANATSTLSRIAEEGHTSPQKPPRPVRLFAPPEPIEAVMWIVPDDPPSRFTWRRRPHRVTQADGPERIADEWWQLDGRLVDAAGDPGAIRDYYRVEDETGRRFWLFRAGLPGDPPSRWFIHGVFA
jgi:protein ImuB